MQDKNVIDGVFPKAGSDDHVLPVDDVGEHVRLVPQDPTVAFVEAAQGSAGFDVMVFKNLQ